ncbi:MAG: hypothetical protein GKR94_24725 [Gammaproteobacteria bacterium]|nr:hypothetical protein [Gammaproteobacteria bacterium]
MDASQALRQQAGAPWGYRRHRPEETVLYRIVEQPADPLFAGQEARGRAWPRYVREEFESYWRCARWAHGLVRAQCTGCR